MPSEKAKMSLFNNPFLSLKMNQPARTGKKVVPISLNDSTLLTRVKSIAQNCVTRLARIARLLRGTRNIIFPGNLKGFCLSRYRSGKLPKKVPIYQYVIHDRRGMLENFFRKKTLVPKMTTITEIKNNCCLKFPLFWSFPF